MNKTTTARIYPDELFWIQKCMRILNIESTPKFFQRLRKEIIKGQRKEFYNKLPQVGEKKPLKGKYLPKVGAPCG